MAKNARAFLVALTANLAAITPALAAGQFRPDSDINGLNLLMSQGQARAAALRDKPTAPFLPLPVVISSSGYRKHVAAGFVVETRSPTSSDPMAFNLGVDRTKVLFDPDEGADDIFAIQRHVNFGAGQQITMATLIASLIEKYGAPSYSSKSFDGGTLHLTWAAAGSGYDPGRCGYDRFANAHTYFYEDVWIDRPLVRSVDETSRGFVDVINAPVPPSPRPLPPKSCGTVLNIVIQAAAGTGNQYAWEMTETLVDLTRGVAELDSFRDQFFSGANAADADRYSRDAANKPKL